VYTLPRQPGSIGRVLDAAAMLFKSTFVAVLPFSFAAAILSLAPSAFLLFYDPVKDAADILALMRSPVYWSTVAATLLVNSVVYSALMARAESMAQGARITAGAACGIGVRRFPVLFLSLICFALVFFLGLLLLVVPGIILLVSMIFYTPAVVIDRKGPVESLTYSHGLVWGNWWRTSVLLTVGFIVIYVLFVIVAIGLQLLAEFLAFDRTTRTLVEFSSSAFVTLVSAPFANALMLEIYRDLKLRKEGADLAQRLAALRPASA
jgi:hypothetical protein